ncbi:MAG: nuclear transport factor 2 family protein [Pelagibacterales bacterium]|nr:nuclear transport factor 2 family protein [Pelagibacterales bacterium]
MKKLNLILLSSLFIAFSCDAPQEPQVIGYSVNQDGIQTPVIAGPESTSEVWSTYIDAHNERDMEGISNLNSDEFSAYGPAGEYVDGNDAHREFLTQWFETNNPKWNILWSISNTGESSNGDLGDYVTAGHQVTLNVDGEDITVYQVIDALIIDGKVQMFNVYQQERAQVE